MLDITKLRAVTTAVTHGHCSDGIASAIIIHAALPDARILEVKPDSDEYTNLEAVPGMLFCDISPPRDRVDEFLAVGALVLDHHESAREIVSRFAADGVFGDTLAGVSGAVLAYQEVYARLNPRLGYDSHWPEEDANEVFLERFSTLIGIRDTHQIESPQWDEAGVTYSLLRTVPLASWLSLSETELRQSWNNFLFIEKAAAAKRQILIEQWVGLKTTVVPLQNGMRLAAVNNIDELGNIAGILIAANKAEIVIGFEFTRWQNRPCIKLSIRGVPEFNCQEFASRYEGGGGHVGAAGLTFPIYADDPNPITLIQCMLDGEVTSRKLAG